MTHWIQALVGPAEPMLRAADRVGARCVALTDDLCLVPMTDELFDSLRAVDDSLTIAPFARLTASVWNGWLEILGDAPFGYLETEYWGGEGVQRAAARRGRDTLVEPAESPDPGPVNDALRALGVARGNSDEWDTVGLARFRTMDDLEHE